MKQSSAMQTTTLYRYSLSFGDGSMTNNVVYLSKFLRDRDTLDVSLDGEASPGGILSPMITLTSHTTPKKEMRCDEVLDMAESYMDLALKMAMMSKELNDLSMKLVALVEAEEE